MVIENNEAVLGRGAAPPVESGKATDEFHRQVFKPKVRQQEQLGGAHA